jgi:hypothetical protein
MYACNLNLSWACKISLEQTRAKLYMQFTAFGVSPTSNFKCWKFQLNTWTRRLTLRQFGSNFRNVRFKFLAYHIPS